MQYNIKNYNTLCEYKNSSTCCVNFDVHSHLIYNTLSFIFGSLNCATPWTNTILTYIFSCHRYTTSILRCSYIQFPISFANRTKGCELSHRNSISSQQHGMHWTQTCVILATLNLVGYFESIVASGLEYQPVSHGRSTPQAREHDSTGENWLPRLALLPRSGSCYESRLIC